VEDGRNDVIARLAEIDVVIGVHRRFAAADAGEDFIGAAGDDFIGVHIGGGARPGLKDVHRKLVIELALGDFHGGLVDSVGEPAVQQPQVAVDLRGALLDPPQGADEGGRQGEAAHGKIGYSPLRLSSIVGVLRHRHGAEGVCFPPFRVHCQARR